MDQCGFARLRDVAAQPCDQFVGKRVLAVFRRFPARDPALDLAFDVSERPAELAEPNRGRLHPMERSEYVDEHLADAPAGLRVVVARRHLTAHDDSMTARHDLEFGADDRDVVAEQIAPRRQLESGVEHRQNAIFAAHVVRARRYRAQRRTAQHVFGISEADQIGEIGVAATELTERKRSCGIGKMRAKVRLETRDIEAFVGADRYQFGIAGNLRRDDIHRVTRSSRGTRLQPSEGPFPPRDGSAL